MVRRLLLLSGLSILCVILFHGAGWGLTGMLAWSARYVAGGSGLAGAAGTPGSLLSPVVARWAKASWWSLLLFGALVQVTVSVAPLTVVAPAANVLKVVA